FFKTSQGPCFSMTPGIQRDQPNAGKRAIGYSHDLRERLTPSPRACLARSLKRRRERRAGRGLGRGSEQGKYRFRISTQAMLEEKWDAGPFVEVMELDVVADENWHVRLRPMRGRRSKSPALGQRILDRHADSLDLCVEVKA